MKHISFFIVITSAITTLSMSSCAKDDLAPCNNENFTSAAPVPYTIDLIASKWGEIATGVYTCPFPNIIPRGYRQNQVKVYLLKPDQKIQMNDPIPFMGGELSATTIARDVTINYRHYGKLPFDYLDVKIVIE